MRAFGDIDGKLKESDIFYVKLHPYVKQGIDCSVYRHIREFPSNYETYDFLTAADVLVTDYSSIMFDFGVTKERLSCLHMTGKSILIAEDCI